MVCGRHAGRHLHSVTSQLSGSRAQVVTVLRFRCALLILYKTPSHLPYTLGSSSPCSLYHCHCVQCDCDTAPHSHCSVSLTSISILPVPTKTPRFSTFKTVKVYTNAIFRSQSFYVTQRFKIEHLHSMRLCYAC